MSNFNFETLLPYAFALILAFPFLGLVRQYVYKMIELKTKELAIISQKNNNSEIKLQAYERMTLFLERIKPTNLVQKFDNHLSVKELSFLLERNIVEEFEYNLSQQLYIKEESWENILTSKNNVLHLIQQTVGDNPKSVQEFKTLFLMNYLEVKDYLSATIDNLRNDVNQLI